MNIVVVGMGEVGSYIASVLIAERHNVTIVDQNQDALNHAEEQFDAMTLRGHGANLKTLQEADAARADLFVAVTDHDEVNIISAIRAKQVGAKRTIARVLNPAYFESMVARARLRLRSGDHEPLVAWPIHLPSPP